ncbi:MAG: HD domain-containing protein, partial [Crocinitomicaceae bacterium]|nr:HD domain-containing protein [Crocinitomicaceae bacterium]
MIIEKVYEKVKKQFETDTTGHDWHHIQRVVDVALYIQEKEGGDREIVELAALLHDISDHKLNGGKLNHGGEVATEILNELGFPSDKTQLIASIVDGVSYKGAGVADKMDSIEGKIVQDADRLDAIGAIGIA